MAYTITIDFPSDYVNSTDYVELQLQFTVDLTGTNQSWQASEKGLEVMEYGTLKLNYDIDDPLLVPSSMDFVIGDKDSYLDGLLFGSSTEQAATAKKFKVTLSFNGSTIFIGHIDERDHNVGRGDKIVSFIARPGTDLLNNPMFNENGEPTDNLGYLNVGSNSQGLFTVTNNNDGTITLSHFGLAFISEDDLILISGQTGMPAINGWHYAFNVSGTSFDINVATTQSNGTSTGTVKDLGSATNRNLVGILTDAYEVVNSGVSLDTLHNWDYRDAFANEVDDFTTLKIEDYDIAVGSPTDQRGHDNIVSLKDMLKVLAKDFGAFTGMVHDEQAFFHKLFLFNSGSTQAIPTSPEPLDHEVFYRFQLLDYARIKTIPFGVNTFTYESGTYTADINKRLLIDELIPWSFNSSVASSSNIFGTLGQIYEVKDPSVNDTYDDFGQILADFYTYFRGNIVNCRIDRFVCRGLDYDFLKGTTYGSSQYQIISMDKDFVKDQTTIEAIYLGEA